MEGRNKKKVFVTVLFLFLFSLPLVNAETLTLISEKHSIINHEVILQIDARNDFTNVNKSWDFLIKDIDISNITDLVIEEEIITTKIRDDSFKYNCNNIQQRLIDVNASQVTEYYCVDAKEFICQSDKLCVEYVKTTEEYTENSWQPLNTSLEIRDVQKREIKLNTTVLSVDKGKTKLIRVTWKSKISKNIWGSTGQWEINPASWWDISWSDRITINITAGSSLTDYQILIDGNSTNLTGDANTAFWANTQISGDDVRFVASDDSTELDFWQEYWNDDQNFAFWSKVNSLSSGANLIYMYFGNDGASSASSYTNTFDLNETFDSLTGWTQTKDSGNDWVVNTASFFNDSSIGTQEAERNYVTNNNLVFNYRVDMLVETGSTELNFRPNSSNLNYTKMVISMRDNDLILLSSGDGSTICTLSGLTAGTYHTVTWIRNYNGVQTIYTEGQQCSVINSDDISGIEMSISHAGNSDGRINTLYTKKTNITQEPTFSFGATEDKFSALFTVTGTADLDPIEGVNSVDRTFNNISIYITPPEPIWSWLVDSVAESTDQNYTHSFTVVRDYNITLLMDWNGTVYQSDQTISIGNFPIITSTDYNSSSGFAATPIIEFGNLSMSCTYFDLGETLTYTFQLNDVNVFSGDFDVNALGHVNDLNFTDGLNTVVYYCATSGGSTVIETVSFEVATKNFFFVYDKTGVPLASATEYTLADVNEVVVYKLGNDNVFFDLRANSEVSIFYTGNINSSLGFRISYNDITLVTTSRTFDMDVLDVNSVPVCFFKLQPYFEQLFFSSVERDVTVKNATNGCYHVAATTRYAANDFFSLYAFTVPLSYFLFINDREAGNLTVILEGGTPGTINLDAIVLKNQLSKNIIITGDSATVTKDCGSAADCNTFIITYRNLATNNASVKFTIFNGTTTLLVHTETTNPDNFTFIFDSTSLDFDANILILRLEKTRVDGSIDIETIYFTPEGDVGFLDPTLVLIFSFLLFITGISLVTARFLFGWFGIVIGFIALVLLSFSIGLWWITFLQGVMMMMVLYMGIISVKQGQGGVF